MQKHDVFNNSYIIHVDNEKIRQEAEVNQDFAVKV